MWKQQELLHLIDVFNPAVVFEITELLLRNMKQPCFTQTVLVISEKANIPVWFILICPMLESLY